MGERTAVRLVAWHKKLGGYIDNVPGSFQYLLSGIEKDNDDVVEKNFNEAEISGLRALLKIDLSDNWTLTPGIMYQESESDGDWAHIPDVVGDLETTRFISEFVDEDWYQASLTLEGDIGDLNLVYAGAYLDRNQDSQYDYTHYSEYREDYYAYYEYYCYVYDPVGDCADSGQHTTGDENFNRMSHEVRLQSSADQRFRWIAGLFYQRQEHFFDLQWVIPTVDTSLSVVEDGHAVWQTHQKRVDRDKAVFGEVYFDITDNFTAIGGIRWFDYENSLFGFNGWTGYCTGYYDDNGNFVQDSDGEIQYPCYDTGILDDVSEGDGTAFKVSLEYRIDDQKMIYVTYSEGFRAGGVNRARIPDIPKYEPDWVYNYEFGWKTTWAGGRWRFNGAAYYIDWKNAQFSFLDFSVSPLTIIQNVGASRTKGVEWELDWAATENFTLSFAGSYNDAKLQDDYWRRDDDHIDGLPPNAPKGTIMPYRPELQLTAIGRFNFDLGSLPSFGQVALSYTDKQWNDLVVDDRIEMDGYTVLNLSTGIVKNNWTLTLYANNVTDERGQLTIFDAGYASNLEPPTVFSRYDYGENIIRPRSFGIRWAQRF
jgi:outer membrane receptor protein involved in Fe transport